MIATDLIEPVWTLETAVPFVRMVQEFVQPAGFHMAIAGSVLIRGQSLKDLDVIVYPHQSGAGTRLVASSALREAGMTRVVPEDKVKAKWKASGSEDLKRVEIWQHEGRRVDVFFLS